jgi:hypothetical protein
MLFQGFVLGVVMTLMRRRKMIDKQKLIQCLKTQRADMLAIHEDMGNDKAHGAANMLNLVIAYVESGG